MWQVCVSPYGVIMSAALAFIPLLWLLISLGLIKMPAHKACTIGLALAVTIAVCGWGMPKIYAAHAALEGVALAIWPIIWVTIAAIFLFNVTVKTGAMEKIKNQMAGLSGDRRIQGLIIAWGFGGFLEGVAGFGTSVAIPASILIGLGYNPVTAAIICLIADTVPVAFGAIGIPVITLAKITDLNVNSLTLLIVLQLTPFIVVIPLALVLVITKSFKGLKGVWSTALVAGVSFAVTQILVAIFIGPELTTVASSIVSILATVVWAKKFGPSAEWKFDFELDKSGIEPTAQLAATDCSLDSIYFALNYDPWHKLKEVIGAWAPYILLLIMILGTSNLLPAVNKPLSLLRSTFTIYNGPDGKPLGVDWLLTPGTLIIIAATCASLLQGANIKSLAGIFLKTVNQLQTTIVTVITIVSMAKIMAYSGMVTAIAICLTKTTGTFYPFIAPILGALGVLLTGSDTSSNVLFGALQKQAAIQINADPTWITAANTSGASMGKMISPQSIAVATTVTGQSGKEGLLMNVTLKYCFGYLIFLGTMIYAFAR